MGMDGSIQYLEAYKLQKQIQGEESAKELIQTVEAFTERYANIREKVRAKDLFRKLLKIPSDSPLSSVHEQLFSEWFLFDYMTAQGLTMFNLFLKNHRQQLPEPKLILGALFLTSVFEPVQIVGVSVHQKEIKVKEFYSKEVRHIYYGDIDFTSIACDQYYLVRKIPIVKRDFGIGNIYQMKNESALLNIEEQFEKLQPLSWRTFLKRNSIKFIL